MYQTDYKICLMSRGNSIHNLLPPLIEIDTKRKYNVTFKTEGSEIVL